MTNTINSNSYGFSNRVTVESQKLLKRESVARSLKALTMSKVIVDPRAEANKYIQEKKVHRLFDILGAQLAKHKPADPNEFLVAELQRIADLKSKGQPVVLFAERDIEIMFSIFDLTNRGYVDQTQYLKALSAVGVDSPTLPVPAGDKISKEAFISHIAAEVRKDAF